MKSFFLAVFVLLPAFSRSFISTFNKQSNVRRWSSPSKTVSEQLTAEQADFVAGYLNKHHGDWLVRLATVMSELGAEVAAANVWSGSSMNLPMANLTSIDRSTMKLDVMVERRGRPTTTERVSISIDADPIPEKRRKFPGLPPVPNDPERLAIDDVCRRLSRLAWITSNAAVSGKLIQLAIQLGGAGVGKLPENMYLNQVPHNRYVRQYFYDTCATAVVAGVELASKRQWTNRLSVVAQFPEMNPSMDSYRIGTILEMARAVAIRLAEENLRVRVCVQGSMGVGIFTGVPKQLNGVPRLLQMMDWQSEEGEENEGMVGDYVNFGAIGAEHVQNTIKNRETGEILQQQDDVFLLIAPQSMVGTDSSIIPRLQAMVEAAGDRPVILINADLDDRVSAAGQQSVRGRQERIDFAQSFQTVYHFQNIYISGTSYFPILGSITKLHPNQPWVAHQRRDFVGDGGEIYVPILASETKPDSEDIMKSFEL